MENLGSFIEASAYVGGKTPEQLRQSWQEYAARKRGGANTITDLPPVERKQPPAPKPLPPYEVVRKSFWEALVAIHEAEKRINPNAQPLQFSEHRKKVMRALCSYAIGQPSELIPIPGKCLYVYGNAGTLKTNTMRAWVAMCERLNLPEFVYSNLSLSWERAKEEKEYQIITEYRQQNRVIDEFLRRTGSVNKNGNELLPNEGIIEHRYERWRQGGQRTVFISNVAPNDIAANNLITSITADRLLQMCTSLHFEGGSMRR